MARNRTPKASEEPKIEETVVDDAPKVEEQHQDDEDPLAELNALKAQIETERAARVAAEQRANQAVQQAYNAQTEAGDSQMNLVTSAIERVNEMQANLKGALKMAADAGDTDAQSEIYLEMSRNEAKLLQLQNGLESMKAQPKQAPPRMIQSDPVEAFAQQLTPRAAAWIRRHPECVTDQKLFQKMVAAHNIAVTEDIELDSDEYFHTVEGILFRKHRAPPPPADDDDDDDVLSEAAAPAPRRTAPPSAPVRASSGNGRTANLTPDEREIADNAGQSYEEYARLKALLRKEGRMH